MAKKFNWVIFNSERGYQHEVVAATNADAVAIAESEWLKEERGWKNEVVGEIGDDGNVITLSPIPTFTAKRIR